MSERPYIPFYKPDGMTDEEYMYQIRIAQKKLAEWEQEQQIVEEQEEYEKQIHYEKIQKLTKLSEKLFPNRNNHYASCDNLYHQKVWKIGYTNDYPMQHGDGEFFLISDSLVDYLNVSNKTEE